MDRFLKEIMARYPVDPARVTVTGLSLGGYAVWRFAGSHPEKIAAFAPLSVSVPRLADYIRPEASAGLKGKPAWIINGVKDTIFPIASARSTAAEAVCFVIIMMLLKKENKSFRAMQLLPFETFLLHPLIRPVSISSHLHHPTFPCL